MPVYFPIRADTSDPRVVPLFSKAGSLAVLADKGSGILFEIQHPGGALRVAVGLRVHPTMESKRGRS